MPSSTTESYGASVQGAPSLHTRISWGAVFAGTVIAISVGATLNILGAAIGANLVDTTQQATPEASSFGIGGGIWLLLSNLIGLGLGAYAAARLSGTADGTDGTLHGLATWGTTTLLTALVLGSVAGSAISTVGSGVSSIVGGAARGAGSLASAAGSEVSERTGNDTLQSAAQQVIDRARNALTATGGDPAQMNSDQRKAEIGRLVGQRLTDGQLPQQDRDRLVNLVAAEAGVSPDEARARIQQAEQQAQQTLDQAERQAREAADAAAHAASLAAYFAFGTLLLGAIVAILGARAGTRATYADRPLARSAYR